MLFPSTPIRSVLSLLALAALPSAALAQEGRSGAASSLLRADELHREALRIAEAYGGYADAAQQFERAARLHLRSAQLRGEEDPQAEVCLQKAAHLLHREAPEAASQLMQLAGERAEKRGDPARAADAYLDAASVLIEQTEVSAEAAERAQRLVGRTLVLTASPLLLPEERTRILRRIVPVQIQLAAAKRT